eukprot:217404_1
MGACCATDATTSIINQKMTEEGEKDKRTNKLLFLGPGRSGKSTIFRQLQWLHLGGFTKQDCVELRSCIYYQIVSQMLDIIKYYSKSESKTDYDDALQNSIELVQNIRDPHAMEEQIATAIQYIWNHEDKIKNAFNDAEVSKYQVLDETTEYFWNELDRIKVDEYIPNETDIINVRYRTTGVIEKEFTIDNVKFHIFDVGGQQSERKKWIHCFNEVAALIFVISLACYNEMMYEDNRRNCMADSLELFDSTINNKYFTKTHIILFLNKRDLFEKKIAKWPITDCEVFGDFDKYDHGDVLNPDPTNYQHTTRYIKNKFCDLNSNEDKKIYTHLTFAMERDNVNKVFWDVRHVVTSNKLKDEGWV